MKRNLITKFAAIFAAAIVTIGVGSATAQESRSSLGGGRLEGTWDVRVSIRNCQTGAELAGFDSLTQFMRGGTLIDSTSGIRPSLKTPGHGIWQHLRGNLYRFSFKAFHFDAAGTYNEYRIVTQEAELDPSGDSYTSSGTAQFYTPNGTLMQTGCSSTTAVRFDF